MNIKVLFILLFIIALLVETTLVAFPFVFILSLFSVVLFKDIRMIIIVFFASFAIDALHVTHPGITPLFVLSFALLSTFYQRSLHAADILLFSVMIFILSIMYSLMVGYTVSIVWSLLVFGLLWLLLYSVYSKKGVLSERNLM